MKKAASFVTSDGFDISKKNTKGASFSAKGRSHHDHPEDHPKHEGNKFTTHFYHLKEHLADQILMKSNVSRVGIIGGGVAGIITARIMIDEGIDVTLYETTGQLAGVWAENYVGFGIQVPVNLYEFPDEPLPSTWDFGAGLMIGHYVQQYAQKHGVYHVAQLNSRVQEIQGDSDSGYKLVIEKGGKTTTEEFDLVIVATGVYGKQDKFVPDWKGKDNFKGEIIHCADFFDLDKTENKDVITVGFGKSAFDCAQISAQQAKSSTMLFREVGEIAEIKEKSVILKDGEEKPCEVIIAATGYKPNRTFLPKALKDLKEKDGLWLYRNMIHPDHPKLIFLNSEITTFTNITSPSIQARWLVEMLAGNHELPSKDAMNASIKETQAWKRKVMPNAGPSRASMVQTHQLHYYDQLLKDMGASVRRKQGNPFMRAVKEILEPYRPHDFKSIVTGEFKQRPGEFVETATQSSFWKEGVVFLSGAYFLCFLGGIFRDGAKSRYGQLKVADLWSSDNFFINAKSLSSIVSRAGDLPLVKQLMSR